MQFQLNISGIHYHQLKNHLFSGDGKESVAVALCGRSAYGKLHKLLVHKVVLIPDEECFIREEGFIHWPTERIKPLLEEANKRNMAILKIHSHPTGYPAFSKTDDDSDKELFSSVYGWVDSDECHASAIMLPDGSIFGRIFTPEIKHYPIAKVLVAGSGILIWERKALLNDSTKREFAKRTIQAFGEGTFNKLRSLKIGVVGCSGTGSIVIEQLVRLGVGELVLIDPDTVEEKNLNRILNSRYSDIGKFKVDVIGRYIKEVGLDTKVTTHHTNLFDSTDCLHELCECDVIFGCVDSVDGRDLLNQISTYYLIPYFDLGVKLEANGSGNVDQIVATVHYLQPGLSSLKSRKMYDGEELKAAGLLRKFPDKYPEMVKNDYIKNINVSRPAVISVNMQIASHAVNEFLNRLHFFKVEELDEYAQSTIDITSGYIVNVSEQECVFDEYLKKKVGRGDTKPFLQLIDFS